MPEPQTTTTTNLLTEDHLAELRGLAHQVARSRAMQEVATAHHHLAQAHLQAKVAELLDIYHAGPNDEIDEKTGEVRTPPPAPRAP